MTPAELAGQSMLLRFEGPLFTEEARAAFHEMRPAGVIFFADNLTSREQVFELCAELQAEARALGMPPLIIGVDQEGGIVSRLPADMVTVPGAMALTAHGVEADTERSAAITGEQLRAVGINTTFAPVVDVNNNPANPVIRTRSFGDTVERVTAGALATMRGLDSAHVISCAKHFPGHGDTNVDSHLGLPVISHPMERLRDIELAPFVAAIAAGIPAIMTTHIVFPALDEHPATLSREILTGLLRDDLGFEGVIFTDSLSMDAIEGRYGLVETAIRCKQAGVDVLESNEPLEKQLIRHRGLVEAIETGALDRSLFTATIERLETMRTRYRLADPPATLSQPDPTWRNDAERIAAGTIAKVGGGAFEPIPPDTRALIIDFQRLRSSEAEDPFNRAGIVRDAARDLLQETRVATLSHQPLGEEVIFATNAARNVETLVMMTRDATDWPYQIEICRQAIAATPPGTRIIHVALRGPYDTGILGEVSDTFCTFGDPAVTLHAIVDVLAGVSTPQAALPVVLG